MLLTLALAALFNLKTKAPPRPVPPAIPGDPVATFFKQRRGLARTGGMVDPSLPRGFSVLIYENHVGKEFKLGKTVLPCDPTDQSGYVYLPKTLLTVLQKPSGQKIVIADRDSFVVRSDADIETRLARENTFLAHHQAPLGSWGQRFGRWWRRGILQEPYLKLAYDDGHDQIYSASGLGGAMGELVLVPYLDDGYSGDPHTASTKPAPVPGAMEVVRYLTSYREDALEDLASYLRPKR